MGLPFVVLNMVSAVLFKDLGISDAQIAFWTSLIMWPWTIKFLWSPFLEIFRTKKFFVVTTQLLSGILFGLAALSLHLPSFFAVTIAVFAVVAFSGATHDIAADGVYMSELTTQDQAKYIGWQGAFYNLAKLVATGGLVWFAGFLYEGFSAVGAATFDAYVRSWTVVLAILVRPARRCWASTMSGRFPQAAAAAERPLAAGWPFGPERGYRGLLHRKGISGTTSPSSSCIGLGEGFVMKIVPLFLKADTAFGRSGPYEPADRPLLRDIRCGGVSFGLAAGGLLHRPTGACGALFSRCAVSSTCRSGSTRLLAWFQPSSRCGSWAGASCVEYFGYGFGFVGLTLFMMQQVAPGRHQMAHYAFASGIMNLSVMLTGAASGYLSDA